MINEIGRFDYHYVARDHPSPYSPLSGIQESHAEIYLLSREGASAGYYLNAGDLLSEGRYGLFLSARDPGTDRGRLHGGRSGVEAQFAHQHPLGYRSLYGTGSAGVLI